MSKTEEKPEIRKLFVCDCGDISHQFVVTYFQNDEDWNELFVQIHLNRNYNFFKRFIIALKYVFGFRSSRFGDFDSIILNSSQVEELNQILVQYLKDRQT